MTTTATIIVVIVIGIIRAGCDHHNSLVNIVYTHTHARVVYVSKFCVWVQRFGYGLHITLMMWMRKSATIPMDGQPIFAKPEVHVVFPETRGWVCVQKSQRHWLKAVHN